MVVGEGIRIAERLGSTLPLEFREEGVGTDPYKGVIPNPPLNRRIQRGFPSMDIYGTNQMGVTALKVKK